MHNLEDSIYIKLSRLITIEGLTPSLAAMLLCVALAASNQPTGTSVIANIYLETLETVKEKVEWVEYTRNGIVKSVMICGMPRALNAQTSLLKGLPEEYRLLLRKTPVIDENKDHWDSRGADLFRQVYGKDFDNTTYIMNDTGSDLWCLIKQTYGNVYAETTYLNYIETELSIIVSLIQMNALPQLHNHLNGAKNVGATGEQIKATEIIGHSVRVACALDKQSL